MTYREAFADNGPAYAVRADYTPEQRAELDRQRKQRIAENEARRQGERQANRAKWGYTIRDLKAAIAELPDDMPVVASDYEYGDMLPDPRVVEDNETVGGAVFDLGSEHFY